MYRCVIHVSLCKYDVYTYWYMCMYYQCCKLLYIFPRITTFKCVEFDPHFDYYSYATPPTIVINSNCMIRYYWCSITKLSLLFTCICRLIKRPPPPPTMWFLLNSEKPWWIVPVTVNVLYWVMTAFAFIIRFWRIDLPNCVV